MSSPEVTGLGAMNMDYFYRVNRLVKDGEAEVEEVQTFPGGSAANTIYGLANLGIRCAFIGVVGDDDPGRNLVGDLKQAGADTSLITISTRRKTGSVVAIVDSEGHRSLYVHQGANADIAAITKLASPGRRSQPSILHTSAFVGDKQFEWHRDMLSALPPSIKLSFSPGALYTRRGMEALLPILKVSHILFLNRKELKDLTGLDLEAGTESCLDAGCQMVVVTLGKGLRRGKRDCCCLVASPHNMIWVEAAPGQKHVVDTTGAGDAFAAGFLYGHLKGKPADECGLLGDIMAGFCISKLGARTGLPKSAKLAETYLKITGKAL